MTTIKYKPARWVIKQFGGVRALGRAIGRDSSTVSRWKKPKSEGGTDGKIPRIAAEIVLREATRRGLDITPADILFGRSETT